MPSTSSTQPIQHPLVLGRAPSWASAWGQDEFGIFAEFTVRNRDDQEVCQRLRWIPPGRFDMGEKDRTHSVNLTQSFWIFDTPCSQELWSTVMENPSHFVDPERPVEWVSWEDAQVFMTKMNERAGLMLRLPTEAEWEYSCRAGSKTDTYAGDVEILGDGNAPGLDPIAWYGGNCGHEYDLEIGESLFWIDDKQYQFELGGTRRVGSKLPNKWGLHDMLGNVWEWCQDWYDEYASEMPFDPQGPDEGQNRVMRGGGWAYDAQSVRSAHRNNYPPDYRGQRS